MAVNFEATVFLIQQVIETLFENWKGIFVNINGFMAGRLSMPYFSIDAASRACVANLFRSLRREYRATDIRFILFSPSGVNTDTERRERGQIWKKNRIKLAAPDMVAKNFLRKLAGGKNDIILAGPAERLLAFLDLYFPGLADALFFNRFTGN